MTEEALRRLLYRRDVALARHRAALARSLAITDIEMLALVHLSEQGELPPSTIASLLDLSSGGATALVQRLERGGHVTRHAHPTDRRSTLICLSPTTAARLDDGESPLADGLAVVWGSLTEAERETVAEVFRRLASLSEQMDAPVRRDNGAAPRALSRPVPSLWA